MKQIYKISILIIVSLGLSNCATNSSKKSYKPKKSTIPKVPAKQIPGGTTDNWRYLGTSQDGQIAVEISESSISKTANSVKFQDRKTLTNTQKNSTSGTIGNYKYSLSWWNMDCSSKQYYINNTAIYDDYGKLLKNYNFSSTQAITISGGSIAELQYNYVCQGVNRQIGY